MNPITIFLNEFRTYLTTLHVPSHQETHVATTTGVTTDIITFQLGSLEYVIEILGHTARMPGGIPLSRIKYRSRRPLMMTCRLDYDWPMVAIPQMITRLEANLKQTSNAMFGFTVESGVSSHEVQAITVQYVEYVHEMDMATSCAEYRFRIVETVAQTMLSIGTQIAAWFENERNAPYTPLTA